MVESAAWGTARTSAAGVERPSGAGGRNAIACHVTRSGAVPNAGGDDDVAAVSSQQDVGVIH